jgi:galactofuranosylgalactofuranosylrhamnosyl-N-acetylglucosaminyl-diphospho-decaprenol beta-1,5/1,6-galactofuranosyltransferase
MTSTTPDVDGCPTPADDRDWWTVQPWLPPGESRSPRLCVGTEFPSTWPCFRATTHTYFGRFAARVWAELTGARSVAATGQAPGWAVARLMVSSADGAVVVAETPLADDGAFHLAWELADPVPEWAWVEVLGGRPAPTESVSVDYAIDAPPRRAARAGVAICTFERPDLVGSTVAGLLGAADDLGLERIVVVDQGRRRHPWAAIDDPRLTVLTQPNLGGAGGFARALAELAQDPGLDCVVIMDDDIAIHPTVLHRVLAAHRHAERPGLVATQMLNLRIPEELHHDAETVDLRRLWSRPARPGRLNVSANTVPARMPASDMAAWWCALVPMTAVRAMGLPAPLFLHWDDIEYSLRATRRQGLPCVTIPGAGVWHEPFDAKSPWGPLAYFDMRNRLAGGAVYGARRRELARIPLLTLALALATHRYVAAEAVLLAMADVAAGDPETFVGDQRARLDARLTVTAPALPEVGSCRVLDGVNAPSLTKRSLAWRTVRRAFVGESAHECVAGRTRHFSRAVPAAWPYVVVRNRYGAVSEVLLYDRTTFWRLACRAVPVSVRYLASVPGARRRWPGVLAGASTRPAWERQWQEDGHDGH